MGLTRRDVLRAGYSGSAALVCAFLAPRRAQARTTKRWSLSSGWSEEADRCRIAFTS